MVVYIGESKKKFIMGNLSNKANLGILRFPKGGGEAIKGVIADFFDIDSDFSENEECFRNDTTSMGYQSESQRCADEVYEKIKHIEDRDQIEAIVEEVCGYSFENGNGTVNFLIGNEVYSGDSSYEVVSTNDEFIVAIAYTT